jgi:hypothetical protein
LKSRVFLVNLNYRIIKVKFVQQSGGKVWFIFSGILPHLLPLPASGRGERGFWGYF